MMKSILKKTMALTCVAVTLACCAACGSANADTSDPKDPGNSTKTVTITVGDKLSTLTGQNAWIKQKQEEWDEDNPDIIIDRQTSVISDSKKNVQMIINNLNNPSSAHALLTATSYSYAKTVYKTGLSEDWSKYLTDEELATIDPAVLAACKNSEGALVAYPIAVEYPMLAFSRKHLQTKYVKEALGVNPDAADSNAQVEAIIDNIKTWDDFYKVAEALTGTYAIAGSQRNVSGYAGYMTDYYIGYGVWQAANGHSTCTQNADGTINFDLNNTAMVETLEFLQKLKKDGIMKTNVYLQMADFFGEIFSGKVASFIFYPSWASGWFEPNGIFASDLKIINVPIGPSLVKQQADSSGAGTIEEPKTNVFFTNCMVLNKRMSEEEKKAAVKYTMHFYSKNAWAEKMKYTTDEMIPMMTLAPYKYDAAFENEYLFNDNIPSDWIAPMKKAKANPFYFRYDSDGFISFIDSLLPGIVQGEDGSGKYNSIEAIKARLTVMTNSVKSEWLNAYNDRVLQG